MPVTTKRVALNYPNPRTSPIAAKASSSGDARYHARVTKKKRNKGANKAFDAARKTFNAARKTGAKVPGAGKIAKNKRPGLYVVKFKKHEEIERLAALVERMRVVDPDPDRSHVAGKAHDVKKAKWAVQGLKSKSGKRGMPKARGAALQAKVAKAQHSFQQARKTGAKVKSAGMKPKPKKTIGMYFTPKHHEEFIRLAGLTEWWKRKKKAAEPAAPTDGDPSVATPAAPPAPPKDPDDGAEKPLPPNKDGFVKGSKGKWPTKPNNYMGCSAEPSFIVRKRRVQE